MIFADHGKQNSILMAKGLQLRVFKVLKEGLDSEIVKVGDRESTDVPAEDALMFEFVSMFSSMSASEFVFKFPFGWILYTISLKSSFCCLIPHIIIFILVHCLEN